MAKTAQATIRMPRQEAPEYCKRCLTFGAVVCHKWDGGDADGHPRRCPLIPVNKTRQENGEKRKEPSKNASASQKGEKKDDPCIM